MTVYFDMCCLKRPFDDQTQSRVALETAAVLALQRAVDIHRIATVFSAAHEVENARNPLRQRARAVDSWLSQWNQLVTTPDSVRSRTFALRGLGFGTLDAAHIAWAEHLKADVLVTVDDSMRAKANRQGTIIVRVANPIELVEELGL